MEQNYEWLFYHFDFEMIYDFLNSKNPCILLNNNINFNKKTYQKTLLYTLLLLVSKIVENFQSILDITSVFNNNKIFNSLAFDISLKLSYNIN